MVPLPYIQVLRIVPTGVMANHLAPYLSAMSSVQVLNLLSWSALMSEKFTLAAVHWKTLGFGAVVCQWCSN